MISWASQITNSWLLVEEKLEKPSRKRKREVDQDSSVAEETSSTESETEDDDGELVTEALDSEINRTLDAIRSKDPRVYDTIATFYTPLEEDKPESKTEKDAKPIYLMDYHRKQLLNGSNGNESDTAPLQTYTEEQEVLQRSVVREINAAAASNTNGESTGEQDDSASDEDFLVMKQSKERKRIAPISSRDVENADRDPETFLSNFMSSRAWIPTSKAQLQPFESDDEDEDRRAEEFEEVYNFRFEDPNKKLVSHARDVASKYSVRREETNSRKKRRDIEKERKEALNQEHAEEKARYRRLKIEQLAEKLNKIKRAAGLKVQDLDEDDWARFLDDRWENDRWEQEMQKRFSEAYYAEDDIGDDEDDQTHQLKERKSKLKKPKWDDDIDIKDLVPDFEDDEMPSFTLSDEDGSGNEMPSTDGRRAKKTSKDFKKELQDKKKIARKERRLIERLVDEKLEIDTAHLSDHTKAGGFRYRDTSPVNYGLTARDILLAADSKLNEFAGLKKLAPYRPVEKKQKDRKQLGKKARLRKWRKETFGDEEGLTNVNLVYETQVQDNKKADEYADDGVTPAKGHLRKK
jgi:protein KRI1